MSGLQLCSWSWRRPPPLQRTVEVAFAPGRAGGYLGEVVFHTDLSNTPDRTVAVSGAGVAPAFTASPAALDFGAVTIPGSASGAVTIRNSGDADLLIGGVSASGEGFRLGANDCGAALAPDEQCAVEVAFAPTTAGPHQGELTFATNVPGQPSQAVLLAGVGAPAPPAPPVPTVPATPLAPPPPLAAIEETARARVTPSGKVALRLDCAAPTGQRCQGRVQLRNARAIPPRSAARAKAPERIKAGAVLGSRSFALAPGSRHVSLTLNKTGRRALSRVARVRAVVVLSPSGAAASEDGIALLASRAPALVIRSRAVRRGPKGGVRVRVTCRAPRDRRCHGRLELGGGGRQNASHRVTVRGGRRASVRVRLPRAACRKAGAVGRIRVRARTTTTIPVGLASRRGRTLTVTC